MTNLSRRDWLGAVPAALGVGLAAGATGTGAARADDRSPAEPFIYGLNTSTIMGQKLTLAEEVDLIARAGYGGIEPWVREMDEHVKAGGSLKDLGKRIKDNGLGVESVIGFFEWAVDDDARRRKGLEEARRNMAMCRDLGGKRLAAPPIGATDRSDIDLRRIAERYRALLELGDEFGVVPEVEVWGPSKTLGRLSEAAFVAIEAGHPSACILPDVYHLYKGGSPFEGIKLLGANAFHAIHMNDYPANPPRDKITDAERVYPGDGVAPLKAILRDLRDIGFRGMLSLELFNRNYWKDDAMTVLKTGLAKMKAAVREALA